MLWLLQLKGICSLPARLPTYLVVHYLNVQSHHDHQAIMAAAANVRVSRSGHPDFRLQ
jgi:hypothetical protein